MDWITILGLVAASITTYAFVPQVVTTWRLKETKDISLGMYIIFCIGIAIWVVYGIIIKNWPIILADSVTLVLASTILFFKIKYG
jgi:MtN3 and saliva related transmembrane protein